MTSPTKSYQVAKPDLSGNEKKYVNQALDEGWVSSGGRFIEEFEKQFAAYVGTKHAVACSSGTNALILALRAANIGKGDEVIVPEFTMVATAWAVSVAGAKPVFVDCDSSMNINTQLIEQAITPKTKAIIPVHIYGLPADMKFINQLAYEYNLVVIEDAAEAHGATIGTQKVGSIGDMGCFSFFGNKIITTGEGGIITTNNDKLADQLRHLRSMGFDPEHTFLHKKLAYNFRMTNLQAAVGLAQLERIDTFLEKRKQILSWYNEFLSPYKMPLPEGAVCWFFYILFEGDIIKIRKALKDLGVETRHFFKPMSQQPMYLDPNYKNTTAYDMSLRGLYFPTYTSLTKTDVKNICNSVTLLTKTESSNSAKTTATSETRVSQETASS